MKLKSLWNKHISYPLKFRHCADYGFESNPKMDALCERFDASLRQMWFAKAEQAGHHMINSSWDKNGPTQIKINGLVAEQKAIQDEGGEKFKNYLTAYFEIVKRWRAGEWRDDNPPTVPGGWVRFRTACNWRE